MEKKNFAKPPYPFQVKPTWWVDPPNTLRGLWHEVVREGARCAEPLMIERIEIVPLYVGGEDWVTGAEMLRRAGDTERFRGCQGWSQHHAEHLLARVGELPGEWSRIEGTSILFPDTVLAYDDGGYEHIPYLYCLEESWRLDWQLLSEGFDSRCHFLRLMR